MKTVIPVRIERLNKLKKGDLISYLLPDICKEACEKFCKDYPVLEFLNFDGETIFYKIVIGGLGIGNVGDSFNTHSDDCRENLLIVKIIDDGGTGVNNENASRPQNSDMPTFNHGEIKINKTI